MISKAFSEKATLASREELLEHASLSVLQSARAGIPEFVDWTKGNVIKRPLPIYDINGNLLFLDYTVKRGGRVLGTVRTGASKILGAPVIAHELGARYWNFNDAVKKLTPTVRKDYPRWEIRRTRLVCYSYPKLGVMFEMTDEKGKPSRLIFDIASLSLIPEKPVSEAEGVYAWSLYDSIPESMREAGLKKYGDFDEWRLSVPGRTRRDMRRTRRLGPFLDLIDWPPRMAIATKRLQFCPHYASILLASHHCFILHCQQVDDYCAVATCQMILCYYRYYYSQDDIAPHLDYSPGGGCPPDQSAGYKSLTCNHLDATYDTSPTWEKGRDQIDGLHPLKSGIPGHARACAGYYHLNIALHDRTLFEQKKLLIYDPWPWNPNLTLGGSVYWEDWNSILHTNFIYTQIKCP